MTIEKATTMHNETNLKPNIESRCQNTQYQIIIHFKGIKEWTEPGSLMKG